MKTIDELDALHAAASARVSGPAIYTAWPAISARLRAAEAILRALVACDDAIAAGREPPTSRHDLADQARAALGEP